MPPSDAPGEENHGAERRGWATGEVSQG